MESFDRGNERTEDLHKQQYCAKAIINLKRLIQIQEETPVSKLTKSIIKRQVGACSLVKQQPQTGIISRLQLLSTIRTMRAHSSSPRTAIRTRAVWCCDNIDQVLSQYPTIPFNLPQPHRYHQLQPRPYLVYRANLYVNQVYR
jgi:signal-transduction protein with cAMP-binding, CBS, and nucleotidyltransferase domain